MQNRWGNFILGSEANHKFPLNYSECSNNLAVPMYEWLDHPSVRNGILSSSLSAKRTIIIGNIRIFAVSPISFHQNSALFNNSPPLDVISYYYSFISCHLSPHSQLEKTIWFGEVGHTPCAPPLDSEP